MILADWAAVFADTIFEDPAKYNGVALLGVLFYTIQLTQISLEEWML